MGRGWRDQEDEEEGRKPRSSAGKGVAPSSLPRTRGCSRDEVQQYTEV